MWSNIHKVLLNTMSPQITCKCIHILVRSMHKCIIDKIDIKDNNKSFKVKIWSNILPRPKIFWECTYRFLKL